MSDRRRRLHWGAAAFMALMFVTLGLDAQTITNSGTGWAVVGPMGVIVTVGAVLGIRPPSRPAYTIRGTPSRPASAKAGLTVSMVLVCLLAGGALDGAVAHWGHDLAFSAVMLVVAALQIGLGAFIALAAARKHGHRRAAPNGSSR